MSKHNDQKINDVLKDMVNQMKNKSKLHQSKIRSVWEEAMGKMINTYTKSLTLRKTTLYITISSSPLRQELSYNKEKIKELLNKEIGHDFIEEVVIR